MDEVCRDSCMHARAEHCNADGADDSRCCLKREAEPCYEEKISIEEEAAIVAIQSLATQQQAYVAQQADVLIGTCSSQQLRGTAAVPQADVAQQEEFAEVIDTVPQEYVAQQAGTSEGTATVPHAGMAQEAKTPEGTYTAQQTDMAQQEEFHGSSYLEEIQPFRPNPMSMPSSRARKMRLLKDLSACCTQVSLTSTLTCTE